MDALLTAALDDAATAYADLLPDVVQIFATSLTPDGYGGQNATETVSATVPGSWVRLTGQQLQAAEKVAASATVAVTVPRGTPVSRSNAVAVAGRRFEVVWVDEGSFKPRTRLLCAEVPAGVA